MKWIWRIVVLGVVAGGAWFGWRYFHQEREDAAEIRYRTAKVVRMDVRRNVEATGTVQPIKEVEVGAQVNGRILKLFVDYNSIVTNGQVVALIDPQVYEANYKSALGELHSNMANVKKCEAQLVLAEKTLVRKRNLAKKDMAPVEQQSLLRIPRAVQTVGIFELGDIQIKHDHRPHVPDPVVVGKWNHCVRFSLIAMEQQKLDILRAV